MEAGIKYFNSEEAAKILGVNVSTIKRWTDEGKLECIKSPGGHRKFLLEHLASFLEHHKKKTEKVNLFPIETETDLKISHHIIKGDFTYLTDYMLKQALNSHVEKLQQVLNGLYLGQYSLFEIYDHLVTPVMYRIGKMWEDGKLAIAEEHLASKAIIDSVIRLQGIIRLPRKKSGKAVCLNFTREFHSLALTMVSHILEIRGFRVFNMGQNTPLDKMEAVLNRIKPDRVYVSGTVVEDKELLEREFNRICELCSEFNTRLYVGGRAFDVISINHPAVARRLMNFHDVNTF